MLLKVKIFLTDFNPRPREEGDLRIVAFVLTRFAISIHALVKRATRRQSIKSDEEIISIHALVKRATALSCVLSF